jgi:hypothetical protein
MAKVNKQYSGTNKLTGSSGNQVAHCPRVAMEEYFLSISALENGMAFGSLGNNLSPCFFDGLDLLLEVLAFELVVLFRLRDLRTFFSEKTGAPGLERGGGT